MTAEQFLDSVWQITDAAPDRFDAPVFRAKIDPSQRGEFELQAKWIWGDSAKQPPPGGETIVLRKLIDLKSPVRRGGVVLTCDNSYVLFVNRREADKGDDFTEVRTLPLHTLLKKGKNDVVVIAKNAGSGPNPAGFFFDARLELENGERLSVSSDESWEWNPNVATTREGRLGGIKGEWKPVTVVDPVGSWTQTVDSQASNLLAVAADSEQRMVRASLLKNTALMKSLGRPMRDQIVSMRPTELTTLEAIDLSNEASLAQTFSAGAKHLLAQFDGDPDRIVRHLYLFALSREPTPAEQEIIREMLGDQPTQAQVEDLLWSVCMLPEFLLIR
jgi:hypothetical protein